MSTAHELRLRRAEYTELLEELYKFHYDMWWMPCTADGKQAPDGDSTTHLRIAIYKADAEESYSQPSGGYARLGKLLSESEVGNDFELSAVAIADLRHTVTTFLKSL